jgi:hypothetical protein
MREIYFSILGYGYTPYDGNYRWHSYVPNQEIVAAVEALPTEQEAFLRADLDTDSSAQSLAAVVPSDRFASLKTYQTGLIRALRAVAYQNEADGLFFGHEADGDSRNAWLNKRIEIKNRYPWPGAYR